MAETRPGVTPTGCQQVTKAQFRNCPPGSCGLCAAEGWRLACRREIFRGRKTRGLNPGWEKIGTSALRSAGRSQPGGNTRGCRHQGSLTTSGGFREVKRGDSLDQDKASRENRGRKGDRNHIRAIPVGRDWGRPSVLKYQCLPASTADPAVWLPFLIAASFNGFSIPASSHHHVGYSAHRASAHQPRSVDHNLYAAGGVHSRCRRRTRWLARVNKGRRQGRCVPRTGVFPREGLRCHIVLATNVSRGQGPASTASRMGLLFPRT